MKAIGSLFKFLGRLEGFPIAMVLLALYIVLMLAAPTVFLDSSIYMSFLETVPPTLIAALGLTLVITAGAIHLSFPAVVALSAFALSWCCRNIDPSYTARAGITSSLPPS